MSDLPTVIGPAGLQPRTPQAIRAQLIALVAAVRPGYTANLPGSLVEDISSTDVYGITLIDQSRVEAVNSLTPVGANVFLLNQLGQMLGIQQGQATNTSVYVRFTGPAGYVVAKGFTVSDGSFQYTVQDGGIIPTSGVSALLFCLATQPGSWAVPTSTVTQIVTSVPTSITLSVTNPEAGVPGAGTESEASYRARVLQANLAESQGMAGYMKTALQKVSGVQARLVAAIQQPGGGWAIICGGGDPYEVAYAIYSSIFDISFLTGSILRVTDISNQSPGVVTTSIDHNFTTGQAINIVGVVGMVGINNNPLTVIVLGAKQFSINLNTTGLGTYVSGGIVSPSLRTITVTINDYPDTYLIPFINPPQQTVQVTLIWNTRSVNFVAGAAVAQLGAPAVVDYINGIPAGQPINVYELQAAFTAAIAAVLPPALLTTVVCSFIIAGLATPITPNTGIVEGDPEGYFQTQTTLVTITQG